MDNVIAITPSQILAICSAIVVISGAVSVIINLFTKAAAPNKAQNARLDAIEVKLGAIGLRLDRHDELFKNDLHRFEGLEEGNRVTQRAILALLSYNIDGNDKEIIRKAKDDLQQYLIER